jgi:hypothetical protein
MNAAMVVRQAFLTEASRAAKKLTWQTHLHRRTHTWTTDEKPERSMPSGISLS